MMPPQVEAPPSRSSAVNVEARAMIAWLLKYGLLVVH